MSEALLASGAFEQALDAVDVLVVQKVGRLQETLVALIALERAIRWVLVRAAVAYEGVLLFEAHLTLLTLERPLFGVRALVLSQVRGPFEAFPTRCAAEGALSGGLALVMQQFGRLFEMQLAQVTFEKVLAGMSVHVPYQVLPVLKGLLANGAFIRSVRAVSALVVRQVRCLTEGLVAGVALVGFFPRVHPFVTRQFREVPESLIAHGALVRTVRALKSRGRGGTHGRPIAGRLAGRGLLRVRRSRIRAVCFFADRALHGIVTGAVLIMMLRQRRKQRESHFAHATHERLLLYLDALVLQKVCGLVEDLHALSALEGAVLVDHALMLVGIGQVGYVVAACSAFVAAFAPHLQRRLLGRQRVLLRMLAMLRLL